MRDGLSGRRAKRKRRTLYRDTLMCHLTEIPPMRRIDLQPDVRGQNARCCVVLCMCGRLGQSVPIHEIVGGARGSVARRRIVSVAWRNLFIAETAGASHTRHREDRDKYSAEDR